MRHVLAGTATIVLALASATSAAPPVPHVSLGLNAGFFERSSPTVGDAAGLGLLIRLQGEERKWGLGPAFDLDSSDSDLLTSIGGRSTTLGSMRIRPVLLGLSYGGPVTGPLSVSFSLLGGYSFNRADLDERARTASSLNPPGQPALLSLRAGNSAAINPGAEIWYDVTPRVGIMGYGGYMITRPEVTQTTTTGSHVSTWKADALVLKFGVAYRIF